MKETNIDNEEGRHERVWSEERKREKGDTTRCRSERKEGKVVMNVCEMSSVRNMNYFIGPASSTQYMLTNPLTLAALDLFICVICVMQWCYIMCVWYMCCVGWDTIVLVLCNVWTAK